MWNRDLIKHYEIMDLIKHYADDDFTYHHTQNDYFLKIKSKNT